MLFNSYKFLIFFPVIFLLYWALPHRYRKYLLLAASYYFYMCWKAEFIVLILFTTAVSYACCLGMERFPRRKKALLLVSLISNFSLLFFYKYFNFFGESLTALCRAVSIPFSVPVLNIILPVGISFYTFQALSYVIDVYRGKMAAEHDFLLFALFVSYFPQLVAGPIEKAENLLPQLKKPCAFRYEQAAAGLRQMGWGFFKKCVAAAYLAALADKVYNNVPDAAGGAAMLATAAFALQIYCDFSGYSDIAKGCSALMGVELMTNFRAPYFASSVRDFWRRWHISLTDWLREYVYFPLGGSRRGLARTVWNTWVVFSLSGLWHGASWTFVVWGMLHALYLSAELLWRKAFPRERPSGKGSCKTLGVIKTFVLVCIAWVFFRADTMADAAAVLRVSFTGLAHPARYLAEAYRLLRSTGIWSMGVTALSVAVLFCGDILLEKRDVSALFGRLHPVVRYAVYLVGIVGMILLIPKDTPAPFIYFQF